MGTGPESLVGWRIRDRLGTDAYPSATLRGRGGQCSRAITEG